MKKEISVNITSKKTINKNITEEQHNGKEEEVNLEGVIGWVFQH